jgi:hypothetical protein
MEHRPSDRCLVVKAREVETVGLGPTPVKGTDRAGLRSQWPWSQVFCEANGGLQEPVRLLCRG